VSAPLSLLVLVSGQGSNLRALWEAIDSGRCAARIAAVISDRAGAPALARAHERGTITAVVSAKDHGERASWDAALCAELARHEPELIVLAGFMRILGSAVLERFGGRIINVHPSLLPAFPGVNAPAQALAKGVTLSGCTVHLVDAGVDSGPILAQAAVPVLAGDDADALHARIQAAEHRLLPAVVHAIASGRMRLEPAREAAAAALVHGDDAPAVPPALVWPALLD
jgi:formyltetrahydrofolate-dependent phosphoribosylglycinamide formyltransferase